MAQKSLPVLNKINVSMTWYVTLYNKYYKWLSLNTIFCVFMYIKILSFFDIFCTNMLWEDKLSSHNRTFTSGRFFYPVTIYIIDLGDFCILYNFFYKTDLERFQAVTEYALIRDSKYNKHLANFNKRIWLL
jgi:hypothetical protein